MKKIVVICLIVSCVLSCSHSTKEVKSMNSSTRSINELRKLIIENGDTSAYYELYIQYLDFESQDFLVYAMIMANKYDYPQAYFDVFDCLTEPFFQNCTFMDEKMDEKTASIAINYLLLAAEKGHEQAKEMVTKNDITPKESNNVAQIKRIF